VVLPSNTPLGTGTITVSYGGQTSAAFPITVVASAFGFDYYNGALGVATDNNDGHLITAANSAMPGETIDFWGAGDGADTKNTDLGPPTSFDNLGGITALYIGGVPVPIAYQGRSGYQGVDQVAVTLPSNVPLGCAVSVVAVIGSGSAATVSNLVTIAICEQRRSMRRFDGLRQSGDGGDAIEPGERRVWRDPGRSNHRACRDRLRHHDHG
jgi:uncharacterized protein (TIGR03437 family)